MRIRTMTEFSRRRKSGQCSLSVTVKQFLGENTTWKRWGKSWTLIFSELVAGNHHVLKVVIVATLNNVLSRWLLNINNTVKFRYYDHLKLRHLVYYKPYLQSLSYPFLHFLHPEYIWFETTFGTVQKWSFRPLLDSPKGGLNIGILLYLAFENTLVEDYMTEKVFRWFNKDIIVVVRGGSNYSKIVPHGTVVDAGNFPSAVELGKYLKQLGNYKERYLSYLRRKDNYMYYSTHKLVPAQEANCKLCEHLNNLDSHRKSYSNIFNWWLEKWRNWYLKASSLIRC